MTRLSIYGDCIVTQNSLQAKQISIDGIKRRLELLKRERDRIIRQSAPSNVVAQSYDKPNVQNNHVVNEVAQMTMLEEILREISYNEFALDMQTALKESLKKDLADMLFVLEETERRLVNNREVKVFRLAREGKCNQEIADVLGYEIRTVEQTKWQINLKIAELNAGRGE